ncbi:MAG: divergent PAP2 family protein [Roseburia sp.]|nr:divergent PAP2 family protein [Roseburia sp.]MCM1278101.1 divergent PAP2 family protein [Robinsoniella sp.]
MNVWEQLCSNKILVSAITGWFVAQVLKTIIHMIISKQFSAERLVGSGGMPSSHSSTVCALVTATGIIYGLSGYEFAVAAIFAIVVMYDAMGVRRETGKQARILNQMMNIFTDMGNSLKTPEEKLKEFVGHTPLQVLMGAILGILIAILICM